MYLSYLESQQIQYRVDCRPNYRFYVTCGIHNNSKDTSLTIAELDNIWFCYGCHHGGRIIDLIVDVYDLEYDQRNIALKVLTSFLDSDTSSLNEKERKMYDELFGTYYTPDKDMYFIESELKTERLNNNINTYCQRIKKSEKDIIPSQIAKKVCCSEDYVKRFIIEKKN